MHHLAGAFALFLLTSIGEECLNHVRAFDRKNSGSNFDLMIEIGVRKNLETTADRAPFGIVGAVYETWNARLNHRARTHAARFDGDVESCARKPVIVHNPRGLAKHDHLRVSRGVTIANRT